MNDFENPHSSMGTAAFSDHEEEDLDTSLDSSENLKPFEDNLENKGFGKAESPIRNG